MGKLRNENYINRVVEEIGLNPPTMSDLRTEIAALAELTLREFARTRITRHDPPARVIARILWVQALSYRSRPRSSARIKMRAVNFIVDVLDGPMRNTRHG